MHNPNQSHAAGVMNTGSIVNFQSYICVLGVSLPKDAMDGMDAQKAQNSDGGTVGGVAGGEQQSEA